MKKIVVLSVIIFLTGIELFSATIKTHRSNRGESGYDRVEDNHDENTESSVLVCVDPGTKSCGWANHPKDKWGLYTINNNPVPYEPLDNYAINEILNSNYTGYYTNNITIDSELWYRSVIWSALSSTDYEITVSINKAP